MKFEIGEVAIFYDPEWSGHNSEVEITTELHSAEYGPNGGKMVHGIKDSQDYEGCATLSQLRKKKPPQVNQDVEESKDKPYDPELIPWSPPKREAVK